MIIIPIKLMAISLGIYHIFRQTQLTNLAVTWGRHWNDQWQSEKIVISRNMGWIGFYLPLSIPIQVGIPTLIATFRHAYL